MRVPKHTPAAASLTAPFPRVFIEQVTPELDGGRHPVKRRVGEDLSVGADVFKDGHDLLAARICYRPPGETAWRFAPLEFAFNEDRWFGTFLLHRIGRWTYTIEAWTDVFATWRSALEKKHAAGLDLTSELLEGAALVDKAARHAKGDDRMELLRTAATLRGADETASGIAERVAAALSPELRARVDEHLPPSGLTRYDRELEVVVDRERAAFAAWYEMFPRSQGTHIGEHGTFRDAERRLPDVAELGFDVIYLPPIHPIGRTKRKGPNNALECSPDDPGSPWAIGNEHGGHTAIEPALGTFDDFDRFVKRAGELGMEIALDYALQCSPDHPWVKEHPEWFFIRPDGSIKYAENPPKKYEDIYPLDFWCDDFDALWTACKEIFLFWIGHGVRTFRVDNPHTKPLAFWEWVIGEVQREHPDVVFLAEAFTRPKRMKALAKLGFTQSYTYFTWRNSAAELREYLTELTRTEMAEYFRANFFANTPDILHEYLQTGGQPAFRVRLLLAATLSPVYGIYSGFELCEAVPLHAGSEEYINSEKYEVRVRDWQAPGNINADVASINRLRREHRVLHGQTNLSFHPTENEHILFYSRDDPEHRDDLLITVNLDPHHMQHTTIHVPLDALGLNAGDPFVVEDLLTGERYTWRGTRNYVRLDPAERVAHVLRVVRP